MEYGITDLVNILERLVDETNERKRERTNCVDFISPERLLPAGHSCLMGTLYINIVDADLSESVKKQIRAYVFREELLNKRAIMIDSETRSYNHGRVEVSVSGGLPASILDDVFVDFKLYAGAP